MKPNLLSLFEVFIAICLTYAFSLFIYAHVVEEVFYIDIPYINSVTKTDLPNLIPLARNENKISINQSEAYGFFGRPILLSIQKLDFKVELEEAIRYGDKFLANRNTVSALVFEKTNLGKLGKTVIFSSENSDKLDPIIALAEGDRLKLTTESGWIYTYRVIKRVVVSKDTDYILTDEHPSQVIILKELIDGSNIMVIESDLVNVEEDLE